MASQEKGASTLLRGGGLGWDPRVESFDELNVEGTIGNPRSSYVFTGAIGLGSLDVGPRPGEEAAAACRPGHASLATAACAFGAAYGTLDRCRRLGG